MSRKNDEICEIVIEPKIFLNESLEKLPNLTEIEFISDEKRREIFFNLLNSSQEFINDLSETFKNMYLAIEEEINFWAYFIVVVNYWKQGSQGRVNDLREWRVWRISYINYFP